MNPNQMEIKRVFVRPLGQLAADDTLSRGAVNQIVVEWEAGATANATIGPVNFQIEIWDITAGNVLGPPLPLAWSPVATTGNNENTTYEQVEAIPANMCSANSVHEIHACLHFAPNITSFAKSPEFFVFGP